MSLFVWNDSYSVGSSEIDSQHKKLFELAERFHAAMSGGHGRDVLQQTLTELIDYTKHHFATEERLMLAHSYPGYSAHKAEHDALTAKVVKFRDEVAAGRVVVTIDVMTFLSEWLVKHIGEMDKKVGEHLRSEKRPAA